MVPRVKELRYRTRILPDADPTMHPEEKKTMQCPTCGGQMSVYRVVPGVVFIAFIACGWTRVPLRRCNPSTSQ